MNWARLTLLTTLLLVMAALAVGAWAWQAWDRLTAPITADGESVVIEIPRGASFRQVVERLERETAFEDGLALRLYARYTGDDARVQAGEYALEPGISVLDALERFARGEVVQHRITVVEGLTFRQMRRLIEAHPALEQTLKGLDDEGVMAELGKPDRHPEGWFYPSTYTFPRGTTDRDLLARAMRRMERRLEEEWAARADGLPLETPYEALILASIIERETGRDGERAKVAGVFTRRLEKGMRLQTDPTVIYGMGEAYDGRIRSADLRRDTPYNTYTRHGLPPTPIAMPGSASIRAAVNPADHDYLYFVSRGDGSHQFSRTLAEHNRAVRRYILGEGE
ncbi:endolytic transglycosylase MltG [Alkalilimnicola ehrlichii MLHE-1]|uniref:Endolytic murein transglycosylase n=1 Tax=Alkalilimnicola ehrlichii (strain ATCC BAA-1101 / DSM 17681 / MLHE-1) TaxID=187272 RepID=Q0A8S1_ALKEH|nr:endolytic transglycosylase MltG [Alkalilimnicola ehrlichii]ABI56766.1 aminodeoxychorismate lyase [Alkalilimnicola ehrlichii MLHE-1]